MEFLGLVVAIQFVFLTCFCIFFNTSISLLNRKITDTLHKMIILIDNIKSAITLSIENTNTKVHFQLIPLLIHIQSLRYLIIKA